MEASSRGPGGPTPRGRPLLIPWLSLPRVSATRQPGAGKAQDAWIPCFNLLPGRERAPPRFPDLCVNSLVREEAGPLSLQKDCSGRWLRGGMLSPRGWQRPHAYLENTCRLMDLAGRPSPMKMSPSSPTAAVDSSPNHLLSFEERKKNVHMCHCGGRGSTFAFYSHFLSQMRAS